MEASAAVVSAVCAVVTVIGAAFWWRSNASKKAREAAERADADATKQIEAVERIAEALNPDPPEVAFAVEWQGAGVFVLRNKGTIPVTVNAVTNDAEGIFVVEFPFTLNPGVKQRILWAQLRVPVISRRWSSTSMGARPR
mgnify:CR=1 FL=1